MKDKTIRRIELARPVKKALMEFKEVRKQTPDASIDEFASILRRHDTDGDFIPESVWLSLNRTGRITPAGKVIV